MRLHSPTAHFANFYFFSIAYEVFERDLRCWHLSFSVSLDQVRGSHKKAVCSAI